MESFVEVPGGPRRWSRCGSGEGAGGLLFVGERGAPFRRSAARPSAAGGAGPSRRRAAAIFLELWRTTASVSCWNGWHSARWAILSLLPTRRARGASWRLCSVAGRRARISCAYSLPFSGGMLLTFSLWPMCPYPTISVPQTGQGEAGFPPWSGRSSPWAWSSRRKSFTSWRPCLPRGRRRRFGRPRTWSIRPAPAGFSCAWPGIAVSVGVLPPKRWRSPLGATGRRRRTEVWAMAAFP